MKNTIFLLANLIISNAAIAQENTDSYYDIRLKRQLDSTDLDYSITRSNNFRIRILTEDSVQERTQVVIINSYTEKYVGFEIREIGSVGLKLKKSPENYALLYEILIRNGERKIGAWEITELTNEPDFFFLRHTIKVSINTSPKDLVSLVHTVAFETDMIEKRFNWGLDEF